MAKHAYKTSNHELSDLIYSLQDNPADVELIIKQVRQAAEEFFRSNVEVKPIGSAGSGLGSFQSDIDLIIVNKPDIVGDWSQRKQRSQTVLGGVLKILRSKKRFGWQLEEFIRRARVPVLKMKNKQGREIDITYNNLLPCHNTQLLKAYVRMFDPLADLIRLVRYWAKTNGVHGAARGYFSSYSWALLTVFAMQIKRGLPSLQVMAKKEEQVEVEDGIMTNVAFHRAPRPLPAAKQDVDIQNLFCDFFQYYAETFTPGSVASIRLGVEATTDHVELRDLHLPFNDKLTLNLEDPFDMSVKGQYVYRRNLAVTLSTPTRVLEKIRESWKRLVDTRSNLNVMVTMPKRCEGCQKDFSHSASGAADQKRGVWYCVDCYVAWQDSSAGRRNGDDAENWRSTKRGRDAHNTWLHNREDTRDTTAACGDRHHDLHYKTHSAELKNAGENERSPASRNHGLDTVNRREHISRVPNRRGNEIDVTSRMFERVADSEPQHGTSARNRQSDAKDIVQGKSDWVADSGPEHCVVTRNRYDGNAGASPSNARADIVNRTERNNGGRNRQGDTKGTAWGTAVWVADVRTEYNSSVPRMYSTRNGAAPSNHGRDTDGGVEQDDARQASWTAGQRYGTSDNWYNWNNWNNWSTE